MTSPSTKRLETVTLLRLGGGGDDVLGVLHFRGQPIAVTLELAWRNNARNVSCIPLGRYRCVPTVSPRHGVTWQVMDVPNRSGILFHAGNAAPDSEGCILLGAAFGVPGPNGMRTVIGSRIALERFRRELGAVGDFYLDVLTLPDVPAVIAAATTIGAGK